MSNLANLPILAGILLIFTSFVYFFSFFVLNMPTIFCQMFVSIWWICNEWNETHMHLSLFFILHIKLPFLHGMFVPNNRSHIVSHRSSHFVVILRVKGHKTHLHMKPCQFVTVHLFGLNSILFVYIKDEHSF